MRPPVPPPARSGPLARLTRLSALAVALYAVLLPAYALLVLRPLGAVDTGSVSAATTVVAALRSDARALQPGLDELWLATYSRRPMRGETGRLAREAVRDAADVPLPLPPNTEPAVRAVVERARASLREAARLEASALDLVASARYAEARLRTDSAEIALRELTARLEDAQLVFLRTLSGREVGALDAFARLRWATLLWLAGWAGLFAALGALARRRVARPLGALEEALARLRDGDLDVAVPPTGPDELGRVAALVNETTTMLRRRVEEQGRFAAAGQLLADVAHEVNNPLSAILGVAESQLEDGALPEGVRDDAALVRDQARRAARLLRGLLRFVRDADEPPVDVVVGDVVRRALDLLSHQLRLHRVRAEIVDAPDAVARCVATRLEQVCVNLMTNAVQAMAGTSGERTLRVTVAREGAQLCLTVDDTGPGVAPAMRARLFQPFATTKGADGTGLGLFICRRLAREAGGELRHVGLPLGARFELTLPASEAVSSRAPSGAPSGDAVPGTRAAARLQGLTVLVVDDEAPVRQAARRLLEAEGATVREAGDGVAALDVLAADAAIDALLVDVRMPGMDGRTLLAHVALQHPALLARAVALSGDLAVMHRHGLPLPSSRVLGKPVEREALVACLRAAVDGAAEDAALQPA